MTRLSFEPASLKGALAAAALTVFGATNAHAAASSFGEVTATLTLFGAEASDPGTASPFDLDIFSSMDEDSAEFATAGGATDAVASGETAVLGSFFEPLFTFTLDAFSESSVGGDAAEAFSDAFASFIIEISNASLTTSYTVFGDISFDISSGSDVDFDGVEEAFAGGEVILESTSSGDLLGGAGSTAVFTEAGFGGPLSDSGSISELLEIELVIGPDSSEIVFFDVYADSLAASVVPVPAALPLLLSGLAGFAVINRRRV